MSWVYLIHFERSLHHARHYIGFTSRDNLSARIEEHFSGKGATLTKAVHAAGIAMTLACSWEGGRELERRLKRRKNASRICPICKAIEKAK